MHFFVLSFMEGFYSVILTIDPQWANLFYLAENDLTFKSFAGLANRKEQYLVAFQHCQPVAVGVNVAVKFCSLAKNSFINSWHESKLKLKHWAWFFCYTLYQNWPLILLILQVQNWMKWTPHTFFTFFKSICRGARDDWQCNYLSHSATPSTFTCFTAFIFFCIHVSAFYLLNKVSFIWSIHCVFQV